MDPEHKPGETTRMSEITLVTIESGSDQIRGDVEDGTTEVDNAPATNEPFGDESASGGKKFRTLTWWQAAMLMIAETISLGILSLPSVLANLGLVAGLILLVGLGLASTYTGYVYGQFRRRYPWVHSVADAGEILFRPLGYPKIGKEFFGAAQILFYIFSMASHILTWTIAMDKITGRAACTIVWSVVGLAVFALLDVPQTLKNMSWLSVVSFISIIAAVMTTMIAVGVEPVDTRTAPFVDTPFPKAFSSTMNIVFAYTGHVAFFTFISELKDPNDFTKALITLQVSDTLMYIIVAVVVYCYTGPDVKSPAMSSAKGIIPQVAYGLAIPTIIIAGVIYGHLATKYVYVRKFRNTTVMSSATVYSWAWWLGIMIFFWLAAWAIAESIPIFNDLLSLVSSLFASWFTFGLSGMFWLFMNKGKYRDNWKKTSLMIVNILLVLMATTMCSVGLWSSIKAIIDDSDTGRPWSCTPNAG